MSATKQKSSAGKNVLVFFIVFIIFEMLIIFGISQLFKNENSAPSVMGYSFYIMNNGNMGTDVPKGTLVIASEGIPTFEDAGKAYLCKNVEGAGTSVFRLSSVVSEKAGKDGVIYKFYQNNDKTKFYDVKSDNIIGYASVYFTGLGRAITFVKSQFGMIVCVAVPLFILVFLEIIIAFVTHKPKRKYEEEDEDEDENQNSDVQLDDFLFGGRDEGEQIAKRRKMRESKERRERSESMENSADDEETDTVSDEDAEEDENEAVTVFAQTTENQETEIHDITGKKEPADVIEEEKEQAAKAEANAGFKREMPSKAASASLEDLMKLMEAEQDKLKKQLSKNQPKL